MTLGTQTIVGQPSTEGVLRTSPNVASDNGCDHEAYNQQLVEILLRENLQLKQAAAKVQGTWPNRSRSIRRTSRTVGKLKSIASDCRMNRVDPKRRGTFQ
ncbi:MAG: hypothetical protein R3C05_01880 [Pirellulaceae bacterium]